MNPQRFLPEPPWVAQALDHAEQLLAEYPPCFPPTPRRHEALMVLDGPLHVVDAPRYQSVYAFLLRRLETALADIESARVDAGFRLWRLYNMGFVIRTPSVTIGLDIVPGWRLGPDAADVCGADELWLDRVARAIDVLAVTHAHDDHFHEGLRDLMLERGKPVLVAPGVFEEFGLSSPLLGRPARAEDPLTAPPLLQPLQLAGGRLLEYAVYPGHQGDMPNNVYYFRTPEGLGFLHSGDQASGEDWGWIDTLGEHRQVDALTVNCWTGDIWRMIRGVRPGLVVTGHENEMAHEPVHREAYWRSCEMVRDQQHTPVHTLCWGEGVAVNGGT